jgi:hypothetical protein
VTVMSERIKANTPLHEKLKKGICERKSASKRKMDEFKKQWDRADNSMRAYIHERDIDKKRKAEKENEGLVDFVTLEVPYTYATVMTAHTYYCSVMLARTPLWQFSGRHGETQDSVMALEAVMDYQAKVGGHLPPLYHFLYDMAKYSLGVAGVYWDKQEKVVTTYKDVPREFMGVNLGTKKEKVEEILMGFQGNKLYNVRPYDFFPDPRVPVWRFQEGEFCIRETSEGYFSLIQEEHACPGTYINLPQLKVAMGEDGQNGGQREQGSAQVTLPTAPGEENIPGAGFVKITEAYIKLIPSMWGLGDSKRVETWVFKLAADKIIIQAAPLGLYHDMFPFVVMEGGFGSDEFAKFGMVEIIRPMTDVLTWLVNSHFYNVRRALNNQLIVDPSRIVMKDLTKPGQRIMRLKPSAYGSDTRMAVHQLQVSDVTRGHLGDAQYIEQMIQRASAVANNVMGMQEQGGRRSATESRQAVGFSTNRLKTPVEYNSALAFDPLAQMMVSNTQQFLSGELKFAMAGNTLETAQTFLMANSQTIAGAYDYVNIDGTAPIDRIGQANLWKELLMQMARNPNAMMEWDINGMLAHTMKMLGERNIDRFRIKMGSPEFLQRQAQLGNMVPTGRASVKPQGTGTSGAAV